MATLNLNSNYAEQMLSLYLWGQTKPPAPNKIADSQFIRSNAATTTADIDAKSYMDHVGNHLALGQQKMFQIFFNGVSRTNKKITLADIQQHGTSNGNEIELSHEQFVNLFYKNITGKIRNQADAAQLNAYQYELNTDSPDYWQRSFVFGSTKLELDTNNIKYVFDATTGEALRLDNVKVKPMSSYTNFNNGANVKENFDFESNQGTAAQINPILKQIMDPSGIGRTVNINFTNNGYFELPSGGSFTQADYRDYIKKVSAPIFENGGIIPKSHYPDVPDDIKANYSAFFEGLQKLHKTDIYSFLNDEGRIVIFGSEQADTIKDTQAKNLNLDEDIDLSSIDGAFGLKELLAGVWYDIDSMNKFRDHLDKGIVYIAGKGNDNVEGSKYNDKIFGNKDGDTLHGKEGDDELYGGSDKKGSADNNTDKLYGGAGNDTLYGGAGDDELYAAADAKDTQKIDKDSTNKLYGGTGSDKLYGGAGIDTLYGGDDEKGSADNNTDTLYGGAGNDTVNCSEKADILRAKAINDLPKSRTDNVLYA